MAIEISPELVSKLPDRTIYKYLVANLPSRALLNPKSLTDLYSFVDCQQRYFIAISIPVKSNKYSDIEEEIRQLSEDLIGHYPYLQRVAIGQISRLFERLLEGSKESFLRNIESVLEEEFNLLKKPPLQRNKRHDCMIKYNWFMMSPFLEAYDLFIPFPNHTLFWRAFEIQKNGNLDYNPVEHYIKERRGEEAVKEDFDYPFVAYGRSRFEFSPLSDQLQ